MKKFVKFLKKLTSCVLADDKVERDTFEYGRAQSSNSTTHPSKSPVAPATSQDGPDKVASENKDNDAGPQSPPMTDEEREKCLELYTRDFLSPSPRKALTTAQYERALEKHGISKESVRQLSTEDELPKEVKLAALRCKWSKNDRLDLRSKVLKKVHLKAILDDCRQFKFANIPAEWHDTKEIHECMVHWAHNQRIPEHLWHLAAKVKLVPVEA